MRTSRTQTQATCAISKIKPIHSLQSVKVEKAPNRQVTRLNIYICVAENERIDAENNAFFMSQRHRENGNNKNNFYINGEYATSESNHSLPLDGNRLCFLFLALLLKSVFEEVGIFNYAWLYCDCQANIQYLCDGISVSMLLTFDLLS